MRHAARRDNVEREIVDALRRAGASVERLDGPGLPDLLVGRGGSNLLIECKAPRERKDLTPAQLDWHLAWRGQVAVVTTPEEAIAVLSGRSAPTSPQSTIGELVKRKRTS